MRAMVLLRDSGDVERFEGLGTGAALGGVLEALGVNDGFQSKSARSKLVDYNEVEFVHLGHLLAAFLRRSSMTSAESSPRRSRRERSSSQLGGRMKISTALAEGLLDLQCALVVDLQNHVGPWAMRSSIAFLDVP
jgi:hypothetical protein